MDPGSDSAMRTQPPPPLPCLRAAFPRVGAGTGFTFLLDWSGNAQKDPEGFYKLSLKVSNVSVTEKELGIQHVHFQNREFFSSVFI